MWFFGFGLLLVSLDVNQIQAQSNSFLCSHRNPKIVGGVEAGRHEMPFIVSLIRRGGHFCGGTIIHERWILTAGHCICNGLHQFMKPSHIEAVIGLHNMSEFSSGTHPASGDNGEYPRAVGLNSVQPHPEYNCKQARNDIALLELIHPLHFSGHVQPCCLSHTDHDNELAIVSGWGWTRESVQDGERPNTLNKAAVKVWSNDMCEKSYRRNGKSDQSILHTQLCAGLEAGGVDSCWADSGGPLINQEHMLVGIVSTGIGCARPGLPGIYTRVSKFIDWIDTVITGSVK